MQGDGSGRAFRLSSSSSNLALANLAVNDFVLPAGSGGAILVDSGDAVVSATNVTFDGNQSSASVKRRL